MMVPCTAGGRVVDTGLAPPTVVGGFFFSALVGVLLMTTTGTLLPPFTCELQGALIFPGGERTLTDTSPSLALLALP